MIETRKVQQNHFNLLARAAPVSSIGANEFWFSFGLSELSCKSLDGSLFLTVTIGWLFSSDTGSSLGESFIRSLNDDSTSSKLLATISGRPCTQGKVCRSFSWKFHVTEGTCLVRGVHSSSGSDIDHSLTWSALNWSQCHFGQRCSRKVVGLEDQLPQPETALVMQSTQSLLNNCTGSLREWDFYAKTQVDDLSSVPQGNKVLHIIYIHWCWYSIYRVPQIPIRVGF